ncbi:MAG: DUF2285 domain-containing protein [Sphingomonadaceae bacterium]
MRPVRRHWRLVQWLRLLDALSGGATTRELAIELIARDAGRYSAAEWDTSERAQTDCSLAATGARYARRRLSRPVERPLIGTFGSHALCPFTQV